MNSLLVEIAEAEIRFYRLDKNAKVDSNQTRAGGASAQHPS